jgi:hypothetical protein
MTATKIVTCATCAAVLTTETGAVQRTGDYRNAFCGDDRGRCAKTNARVTEDGRKHSLARVVFAWIYDSASECCHIEVRVPWQDAFAYLRAHAGHVEVTGVTFNENGREGAVVSFAKWKRWTHTGLYFIQVGCGSPFTVLEEHHGKDCPCSAWTPSACLIHPDAPASVEYAQRTAKATPAFASSGGSFASSGGRF